MTNAQCVTNNPDQPGVNVVSDAVMLEFLGHCDHAIKNNGAHGDVMHQILISAAECLRTVPESALEGAADVTPEIDQLWFKVMNPPPFIVVELTGDLDEGFDDEEADLCPDALEVKADIEKTYFEKQMLDLLKDNVTNLHNLQVPPQAREQLLQSAAAIMSDYEHQATSGMFRK